MQQSGKSSKHRVDEGEVIHGFDFSLFIFMKG